MPDPTPALPPMDPEFEALVEKCEQLAEVRNDIAVSDAPDEALNIADDDLDNARKNLWAAVVAYGDRRAERGPGDAHD